MKETPRIFSTDMVKAILDDRKTMTRRLDGLKEINQEPDKWVWNEWQKSQMWCRKFTAIWFDHINLAHEPRRLELKPRYQVGSRLWVRETCYQYQMTTLTLDPMERIEYKADFYYHLEDFKLPEYKTIPAIFMPRWASRITLEITGVRVERLQEIDYFGARAEGILSFNADHPDPTNGGMGYNRGASGLPMRYDSTVAFMDLWNSLNAKRGYGWEVNPWVWVISFRRLEG